MRYSALAAVALLLILCASQAVGQQPVHRVGLLLAGNFPDEEQAFVERLKARGYVVGQNLQIDIRHSEGQNERIPALVSELVAGNPEVIVTASPQNAIAVHSAAPLIPSFLPSLLIPLGSAS